MFTKTVLGSIITLFLVACGGGGSNNTTTSVTPSTPPVVIQVPTPTVADALTELNRLRASAGVNPMVMNDLVTKAAQNHADYVVTNNIGNTHRVYRSYC